MDIASATLGNFVWTQGGNDYAGCSGSGVTFHPNTTVFNENQTYWLTSTQLNATITTVIGVNGQSFDTSPFTQFQTNVGMFGVNSFTSIRDATDGTSNVMCLPR